MMNIDTIAMSIELTQRAQTVIISPHIEAPAGTTGLTYRLEVIQSGAGGQSAVSQAGTLDNHAQQNRVTLNVQPGARCRATLHLLDSNQQVLKTVTKPC